MQPVSPGRLCVALSLALLSASASAFARDVNLASPADDFIRRQAEQGLEQRLETLRDMTPDGGAVDEAARKAKATKKDAAVPPSWSCINITHAVADGITLIPTEKVAPLLASYRNRCIVLADIDHLLKAVSALYADAGYVTSRAYLPEQDIVATRVLTIRASEGMLSDIHLNGKPAAGADRGLLATAFPGMKSKPFNMADAEQGLEQINRLSSNSARTAMQPGKDKGSTILNIENAPTVPWHFSVSNNNLGQKSTGLSRTALSFRMDNLAGINDLLSLTYEHSGPYSLKTSDANGQSNSVSGSFSVPYGYWTFTLNGSLYKYGSLVPGSFGSPVDTSGDSKQLGLTIDRVLLRDKTSLTTLNAGLTYKQNNNFLMGERLDVGSRQYPVASLGLSHSRNMLGGLWVFDASYNQGLGLFGATKRSDPAAGDAEPEFSKFTGTINVVKPFQLGSQNLQFSTLINGQYTPHNLYGAEQLSLGGYSTVRGSRDSLLFGNNGVFTRNELLWRTRPWQDNDWLSRRFGELRPYVALDYGHVFGQRRFTIEGGDVSGWTLGARLAGGNIGADLGYSRIIQASHTARNTDMVFVTTSFQF